MDQSRHWHECAHTDTHSLWLSGAWLPAKTTCFVSQGKPNHDLGRPQWSVLLTTTQHECMTGRWSVSDWSQSAVDWLPNKTSARCSQLFFFFFNESCSDLVFKASQIKEVSRWPHSCLPVSVFCRKNIHNNKIFYFKERSGQWKITPAAINNTRRHNCRSWQQTKWKQKQHNMKLHRVQ